jgi:hypothetical protein
MKANDCNIPRTFCNTGIQQLQHRKQKKSHNKVRKELPARAPSAVAGAPPVHNPPPPTRAHGRGHRRVDQGSGGPHGSSAGGSREGRNRAARFSDEWTRGGSARAARRRVEHGGRGGHGEGAMAAVASPTPSANPPLMAPPRLARPPQRKGRPLRVPRSGRRRPPPCSAVVEPSQRHRLRPPRAR